MYNIFYIFLIAYWIAFQNPYGLFLSEIHILPYKYSKMRLYAILSKYIINIINNDKTTNSIGSISNNIKQKILYQIYKTKYNIDENKNSTRTIY